MSDAASTRSLLLAFAAGAALAAAGSALWLARRASERGEPALRGARPQSTRCALWLPHAPAPRAGGGDGVLGAVGNTPLLRIASLSEATGCEARRTHACLHCKRSRLQLTHPTTL